ncbi:sulfotransferase family 2 domain-containing protein [Burkholderiaceae bacterium]|nr:sulfotransferase family 2 domain-containing protein [Burkholderiaceae bacterium]
MIIDKKNKKIFLHVPKVAGSTVRRQLIASQDDVLSIEGLVTRNGLIYDSTHLNLLEYQNLLKSVSAQFNDYTIYTLWRDPVERFHSSMAQYIRNYTNKDYFTIKKDEYRRLCRDRLEFVRLQILNQVAFPAEAIHFIPQAHYQKQGSGMQTYNYAISDVHRLISHFSGQGEPTFRQCIKTTNKSYVLRRRVPVSVLSIGRFISKYLSKNARDTLKSMAARFIFESPSNAFDTQGMLEINQEITDVYYEDFSIKLN